jgi:hypothetical protein
MVRCLGYDGSRGNLDKTYGTAIRKTADAAAKVNAYYDQDPVGFMGDFYSLFDPMF